MARVSHKQLPNDFDHWLDYVNQFANGFVRGASMPPPKAEVPQKLAEPAEQGIRTVLICSPHPDDEVLTGALALRLSQEESATIYNLAVTLGSDPARILSA